MSRASPRVRRRIASITQHLAIKKRKLVNRPFSGSKRAKPTRNILTIVSSSTSQQSDSFREGGEGEDGLLVKCVEALPVAIRNAISHPRNQTVLRDDHIACADGLTAVILSGNVSVPSQASTECAENTRLVCIRSLVSGNFRGSSPAGHVAQSRYSCRLAGPSLATRVLPFRCSQLLHTQVCGLGSD